ncbi:UNVERIFIED_CONTAM: Glucan endo-1,3-beta-glucosidase 7 [Sesamum radiatum]|uniref:Glucan endo-1,3-beta-glucosidase 7 n=1 Tax=Sesamum radiatum TaxID=300843 RepID=A0AAW2W555_SESRA
MTTYSYLHLHTPSQLLLLLVLLPHHLSTAIGVNYGTVADNLPPPSQVAAFITHQTTIDKVKIFDANPDIIKAFANTNISLTITVPNDAVLALAKPSAANSWVANNVLPFYPATKIRRIAVGNEILATGDKNLIAHLLPAMKAIYSALQSADIAGDIQVSTPHSLGILSISNRRVRVGSGGATTGSFSPRFWSSTARQTRPSWSAPTPTSASPKKL